MSQLSPRPRPARRAAPLAVRLVALAAPLGLAEAAAHACGCFAPPDPTTPIVQAGERILFVQEGGQVTAHIQIQYAGRPADFGWLLPLPSVPKNRKGEPGLELGVDELFTQLEQRTQPQYLLSTITRESCGGGSPRAPFFGCGAAAAYSDEAAGAPGGGLTADLGAASPLVATDSVGPYDFAILKADDKAPMLKWLADNRYFIPAGTGDAVAPYIHAGAFFLALRLRAGEASGALQPVVVRYQADVPMIPLRLTAVGATPNMGIEVFLLGRGRAVPRNYYHVVVNDGQLNWLSPQNYNDVVIKAVAEAPERHGFVTEYAGTSALLRGVLLPAGRFSDEGLLSLERRRDPVSFVAALPGLGFQQNGQLYGALAAHIPLPAALREQGLQPAAYYQSLGFYLNVDRAAHPERYADVAAALDAFDPVAAVAELRGRIVTPLREADDLFNQAPYLTRLYTTLSPEDMTADPAFSENRGLPDVSLRHSGTGLQRCDGDLVVTTELGAVVTQPGRTGQGSPQTPDKPFARRIEILRETGAPEVVKDNSALLAPAEGDGAPVMMGATSGCDAGKGGGGRAAATRRGAGLLLGLLGGAWLALRQRRRQGAKCKEAQAAL